MKRRLFSLFLMLIMMFSVGMTASAVYRPETGMPTINGIRSSAYLDGYSVGIEARGNGKIAVAMTVEARSKMEKLGVHEVEIEQKVSMAPNTPNSMITIHGIMLEQPTFKEHPVSATA